MKVESQTNDCSGPKNRMVGGKISDGTTSGNKGIPLHKCEELCRKLPKCTGFNWGPGDKRCWALNGCENPVTNPGFDLYYIEGNLSSQSG